MAVGSLHPDDDGNLGRRRMLMRHGIGESAKEGLDLVNADWRRLAPTALWQLLMLLGQGGFGPDMDPAG